MPKKKGKSISFDAMVKFFMQSYGIPTKRDIDRLMARMDRLEELIKSTAHPARRGRSPRGRPGKAGNAPGGASGTAADTVLEVIKSSRDGIDFADIRDRVGFADKKLRNIIFRLHKTGKIQRIRRGVYTAA